MLADIQCGGADGRTDRKAAFKVDARNGTESGVYNLQRSSVPLLEFSLDDYVNSSHAKCGEIKACMAHPAPTQFYHASCTQSAYVACTKVESAFVDYQYGVGGIGC